MTRTFLSRRAFVAVAVAAALAIGFASVASAQDIRQILAPSGKLRVGLYPGTPTSILPATAPAEPKGVGYELGKELAKQLGVPYEPVVFPSNAEVIDGVKTANTDIAFTNASAARAQIMDFGPPYLDIELGYLAAKDAPIATIAEIDVKDRRIGVAAGSSSQAALSRDLKNATVVVVANVGVATQMLAKGELDAFATNKATLFEMQEKAPGSRVLDGKWGLERHAIAIPKGREAGLPFVRDFTEKVKASGLVQAAIERAGLRGGATAK